ncbi:hypothetical protein HED60_21735 [Planctomycetales bacterium ZRK34]|nr:hypothetical protein HED60_21735 [Planctomycetales bacterium ZRK34]
MPYYRAAIFMSVCCLAGCGDPQINTTRLGSADLVTMTDQMTASLMSSDVIASRTTASAPWVITMDRVSNQSNDIIPEREKWAFMARLRSQLNNSQALSQRNIRFVLSKHAAEQVAERYDQRTTPTHALAATFYSVTEAGRAARSDTYLCAFQLLDLRDDHVMWEDRYEVKYATVRNRFD